jgi:hypothetical protein
MEICHQVRKHVVNQPALFSVRGPLKPILGAATLAAAIAAPAWSANLPDAGPGQSAEHMADPETAARTEWRAIVRQSPRTGEGCFHASYPSIVVERVECTKDASRAHPVHVHPTGDTPEVVGNGHDYAARAAGLITQALGTLSVTGFKSEKSVGGDGGILGSNEYSIQLNTNISATTSACAGHSGCTVWQQFVYATDYINAGTAAVFMQYWLVNWGNSTCPHGWNKDAPDCWKNSLLEDAPDLSLADISLFFITASATAGGSDEVEFSNESETWWVREPDSVLDISSVWREAELNIVGDAGGSEAVFSSGTSFELGLSLTDGSAAAPTCISNGGTTGETNNLNLGKCSTYLASGDLGVFSFTESN